MKAIVLATRDLAETQPGIRNDLSCFLPLMNRPIVQHVIEYLTGQGIVKFDFIISSFPERIRHFLEDGSRWGIQIDFQVVRDPNRPYERLRFMSDDQPMLLVHADRLVWIDMEADFPNQPADVTCLYMTPGSDSNPDGAWTGWGWISSADCLNIPNDLDEDGFFQWLSNRPDVQFRFIQREMVSMQTFSAMLRSHWLIFDSGFSGLMIAGTQIEPGIWLSRNVVLHPLSRIEPPVLIGQNSQILKGVQLGPYAVVGENCMVDDRCIVTSSVICSGSYVGQSLEITDAVVDKNCLINTGLNSTLMLSEDFLLGHLDSNRGRRLNLFNRLFAAALLAVAWPFLLITACFLKLFRKGPVIFKKECVRLPANPDQGKIRQFVFRSFCRIGCGQLSGAWTETSFDRSHVTPDVTWRDFLLRFLPGLWCVFSGNVRVVGVPPRTLAEIDALPEDWRLLYFKSQAGLITEAMVTFGAGAGMDECHASETIYAATSGWREDLKIFFHYLGQLLGVMPGPGSA